MTISDVKILGKKILLGIVVTLVPFAIIFGSLWAAPKLLPKSKSNASNTIISPVK